MEKTQRAEDRKEDLIEGELQDQDQMESIATPPSRAIGSTQLQEEEGEHTAAENKMGNI
ncbi:MAG: hypothetical protein M3209_16450 [Acidobacteriota bacterium]|nr:hypothetical protein [Acidobacteriota bacterium]